MPDLSYSSAMDMNLIATSLIVFACASSGTLAMFYMAHKKAWLDAPTDRGLHDVPTPRGGGLAINIVFLVSLFFLYWIGELDRHLFAALSGAVLILTSIGFLDDIWGLDQKKRFLCHMLASAWALCMLKGMPAVTFWSGMSIYNTYILIPFFFILFVWLINLTNFMDGMDGISGMELLFVAGAALFLSWDHYSHDMHYSMLYFMAGVAGFLVWNFPPAKIFMGDCASTVLGIVIGIWMLHSAYEDILSLWVWLILFHYYLMDSTVTLISRMAEGKAWREPHREHLYQRLVMQYGSHRKVLAMILAINIFWLLPFAFGAMHYPDLGFLMFILSGTPIAWVVWRSR